MTPIPVTPAGTALVVASAPATPKVERRIADLYNRKDAITLARSDALLRKMKGGDAVKKGTMR